VSRNPRSKAGLAGWLAALVLTVVLAPCPARAAATNGFSESGLKPAARARVFIVQDSAATRTFQADAERVRAMVHRGVIAVTGQSNIVAAWRSLVSTQDIVGLKVLSALGPISGTRPAVVAAVVEGLLATGHPPTNIIIWDRDLADLRHGNFPALAKRFGVRLEGAVQAGYDEKTFYDAPLLGSLMWGDSEFGLKGTGLGRKSFVSRLVSQRITKIINIPPLLNHPVAGVSGNLLGLTIGSVDNTWRFEMDAERLAEAVPEIYALPAVGDGVVLNIVDALLCQYQGSQRAMLHYSTVLNEIRVSRDPVALDVLSLKELDRQRGDVQTRTAKVNRELWENAALLQLGVSDPQRIDVQILQ
jgi:uncharacterized protein (DUF362 family)